MKNSYQLEIEEQIECLKRQIDVVAENPSELEVIKATLAAEFVYLRVKGFCETSLLRRSLHGLDRAVA